MAERLGVDVALRGVNELEPAVAEARESLGRLEGAADEIGAKAGRKLQSGLTNAIAGLAAGAALDSALRRGLDELRDNGSWVSAGVAIGEGLADGLRRVPLAGTVGDWLAEMGAPLTEGLIDLWASAGELVAGTFSDSAGAWFRGMQTTGAQSGAQESSRVAAAAAAELADRQRRELEALEDDTLTDAERRRRDFSRRNAGTFALAAEAGELAGVRSTLTAAFEARERREAERVAAAQAAEALQERERAAAEEQRDRERLERERERESDAAERQRARAAAESERERERFERDAARAASVAAREVADRADAEARVAGVLADPFESRTSSGRSLQLQQEAVRMAERQRSDMLSELRRLVELQSSGSLALLEV